MDDQLQILGFCVYCNKAVTRITGYYLEPNGLTYPNVFDTAKPAHRKCHRGQDEELAFNAMPMMIGPGDPM